MEATDFALLPRTYGPSRVPSEAALDKFLTFTDRDGYLAWRADWRAEYKEISANIREMRAVWRAEGSHHEFPLHSQLYEKRARARSMLTLRRASKIRVEQLYQEAKATAEVA